MLLSLNALTHSQDGRAWETTHCLSPATTRCGTGTRAMPGRTSVWEELFAFYRCYEGFAVSLELPKFLKVEQSGSRLSSPSQGWFLVHRGALPYPLGGEQGTAFVSPETPSAWEAGWTAGSVALLSQPVWSISHFYRSSVHLLSLLWPLALWGRTVECFPQASSFPGWPHPLVMGKFGPSVFHTIQLGICLAPWLLKGTVQIAVAWPSGRDRHISPLFGRFSGARGSDQALETDCSSHLLASVFSNVK